MHVIPSRKEQSIHQSTQENTVQNQVTRLNWKKTLIKMIKPDPECLDPIVRRSIKSNGWLQIVFIRWTDLTIVASTQFNKLVSLKWLNRCLRCKGEMNTDSSFLFLRLGYLLKRFSKKNFIFFVKIIFWWKRWLILRAFNWRNRTWPFY